MRHSYPNAHLLANFLIALHGHGKLDLLADQWLNFVREDAGEGHRLTGGDKVKIALDELLSPLPPNPRIQRYEIALQIDTGNTIYQEFDDLETLIEFIKTHVENPETILQRIRPRKKQQ